MKNQKVKTFVITVAKTFPIGHPRYGEPTNFKEQILSGGKIHTMRLNYEYWKPKIDLVNQGKAIISLREWIGLPYKQPGQREFKQLTQADGIGIEKISMFTCGWIEIEEKEFDNIFDILAKNDGLDWLDFNNWFELYKKNTENAGIIHFTSFRYLPTCNF